MNEKNQITARAVVNVTVLLALLLSVFYAGTASTVYARPAAAIPPVALGVAATDGTFPDKVQVSWTAVVEATSYEVYRNTTNDSGGASLLGSPAAGPFDDMTATPGLTYWYFVKACNVDGCSDFSAGDSGYAGTLAVIPAVPTGVAATDGTFTDKVQVSWTAVVDATSYEVYRNTTDDSATASLLGSPAAPPFDDMTATPGVTYWFFVKACNLAGCSDFSASDGGYAAAIPAVPTDVAATDGTFADKVQVSWTAVSGAASYEVYRNTSDDSATASLLGSPVASPFDDTTVTPGVTYWYFVKACNVAGCSDFSASDSGYAAVIPAVPTDVAATDGTFADKVQVSWTAVTGATSYEVYRNTSDDSATASLVGSPAASPFDDTTATPGVLYWYFVKACNVAGCSDFSASDTGFAGILPVTTVTFVSIGGQDGWVIERTESSNKGYGVNRTAAVLRVGDNPSDKQYRSILSFDTSALPDNAFITSATLEIRRNRIAGQNPFYTLGSLLADIAMPYFGASAALEPEDFQAPAGASAVGVISKKLESARWHGATLDPAAYPFLNPDGTTQFRLEFRRGDNDNSKPDQLKFFSGNGPVAFRPILVIQYYTP